jgi:hypothetical protein
MHVVLTSALMAFSMLTRETQISRDAVGHAINSLHRLEHGEISVAEFRSVVRKDEIYALQHAMLSERAWSRTRKDLAVCLAVSGVQLRENVAILSSFARKWREGEPTGDGSSAKLEPLMEDLPTDLVFIWRANHQMVAIDVLVDLQLDGASAEIQADEVGSLWDDEPHTLLLAASTSRLRAGRVGRILADWAADERGRPELRILQQKFRRDENGRLSSAAKNLQVVVAGR